MTTLMPWELVVGTKVTARHLDRQAVIYIRQSSRQQVVDHQESTRLQYALVDRAVALGWVAARVLVIDEDLGKSGASAVARTGFQRLVGEIGLDHVGLVLGIEMSRLARSGRDWYQLMELCAISGTLLGDTDGVYDPGDYNDRLLLGLKGTMAEAELHLIKQRMQSGRLNKARRGELALPLPIGYVRRPSGDVMLDPDEQVRAVVRLIFDKFTELTTTHAVLRYLVDHGIEVGVRLHDGPDKGELEWRRPNRMTLQNMLHSPVYAGIYAYGRRRIDPRRQQPGRPATGRVVRGQDEWLVFVPDVLPAYISQERYRANLAQLAANASRSTTPGTVRAGSALLSGLVRCGMCGKKMTVCYHVRDVSLAEYRCSRATTDYGAAAPCQSMSGACVDAYVSAAVLNALTPAALQVSLQAAGQIQEERTRLEQIWSSRLERAAINVDRARRCYRLAEPENRLVVRQLEKDWETALLDQQHLIEEHDRFTVTCPQVLSPAEQAKIMALASDIPGLWAAPTTTDADRKEIIRAVLTDVTLMVIGTTERVSITVTWAGGHTTSGELIRPVARLDQLSYYPRLLQRLQALHAQGLTAAQIAVALDAEGFHPPKRIRHFTRGAITTLLRRLNADSDTPPHPATGPGGPDDPGPDEWWLNDLARALAMPDATLYTWIQRGWLTARQDTTTIHRWIIKADPDTLADLRERRTRPAGYYTRRRWTDPEPPPNPADHDPQAANTHL